MIDHNIPPDWFAKHPLQLESKFIRVRSLSMDDCGTQSSRKDIKVTAL